MEPQKTLRFYECEVFLPFIEDGIIEEKDIEEQLYRACLLNGSIDYLFSHLLPQKEAERLLNRLKEIEQLKYFFTSQLNWQEVTPEIGSMNTLAYDPTIDKGYSLTFHYADVPNNFDLPGYRQASTELMNGLQTARASVKNLSGNYDDSLYPVASGRLHGIFANSFNNQDFKGDSFELVAALTLCSKILQEPIDLSCAATGKLNGVDISRVEHVAKKIEDIVKERPLINKILIPDANKDDIQGINLCAHKRTVNVIPIKNLEEGIDDVFGPGSLNALKEKLRAQNNLRINRQLLLKYQKETQEDFISRDIRIDLSVNRETNEEVIRWISCRKNGTAFIIGDPGVGKTTAMALLEQELINANDKYEVISYYLPNHQHPNVKSEYIRHVFQSIFAIKNDPLAVTPENTITNLIEEIKKGIVTRESKLVLLLDGFDVHLNILRPVVEQLAQTPVILIVSCIDSMLPEDMKGQRFKIKMFTKPEIHKLLNNHCISGKLRNLPENIKTRLQDDTVIDNISNYTQGLAEVLNALIIEIASKGSIPEMDSPINLYDSVKHRWNTWRDSLNNGRLERIIEDIHISLAQFEEPIDTEALSEAYAWTKNDVEEYLSKSNLFLKKTTPFDGEVKALTCERWEFKRPEYRSYFLERTKEEGSKAYNWCKRWKEHKHWYAIRYLPDLLTERGEAETDEFVQLARDDNFFSLYRREHATQPDKALDLVRTALKTAFCTNNMQITCEFLLLYARRMESLLQSPILQIENGLDAILGTINLYENPAIRQLWRLIVVIKLWQEKEFETANQILDVFFYYEPTTKSGFAIKPIQEIFITLTIWINSIGIPRGHKLFASITDKDDQLALIRYLCDLKDISSAEKMIETRGKGEKKILSYELIKQLALSNEFKKAKWLFDKTPAVNTGERYLKAYAAIELALEHAKTPDTASKALNKYLSPLQDEERKSRENVISNNDYIEICRFVKSCDRLANDFNKAVLNIHRQFLDFLKNVRIPSTQKERIAWELISLAEETAFGRKSSDHIILNNFEEMEFINIKRLISSASEITNSYLLISRKTQENFCKLLEPLFLNNNERNLQALEMLRLIKEAKINHKSFSEVYNEYFNNFYIKRKKKEMENYRPFIEQEREFYGRLAAMHPSEFNLWIAQVRQHFEPKKLNTYNWDKDRRDITERLQELKYCITSLENAQINDAQNIENELRAVYTWIMKTYNKLPATTAITKLWYKKLFYIITESKPHNRIAVSILKESIQVGLERIDQEHDELERNECWRNVVKCLLGIGEINKVEELIDRPIIENELIKTELRILLLEAKNDLTENNCRKIFNKLRNRESKRIFAALCSRTLGMKEGFTKFQLELVCEAILWGRPIWKKQVTGHYQQLYALAIRAGNENLIDYEEEYFNKANEKQVLRSLPTNPSYAFIKAIDMIQGKRNPKGLVALELTADQYAHFTHEVTDNKSLYLYLSGIRDNIRRLNENFEEQHFAETLEDCFKTLMPRTESPTVIELDRLLKNASDFIGIAVTIDLQVFQSTINKIRDIFNAYSPKNRGTSFYKNCAEIYKELLSNAIHIADTPLQNEALKFAVELRTLYSKGQNEQKWSPVFRRGEVLFKLLEAKKQGTELPRFEEIKLSGKLDPEQRARLFREIACCYFEAGNFDEAQQASLAIDAKVSDIVPNIIDTLLKRNDPGHRELALKLMLKCCCYYDAAYRVSASVISFFPLQPKISKEDSHTKMFKWIEALERNRVSSAKVTN